MRQKEVCRGIKPLDKLSNKWTFCVKQTWDILGLDRALEDLKSLIFECKIGKGCIYFRSEIIPRPRLRPVQGLVIVSISPRGKLRLRPMSGGALLPVLPLPGSGEAPRISGSEC